MVVLLAVSVWLQQDKHIYTQKGIALGYTNFSLDKKEVKLKESKKKKPQGRYSIWIQ